MIDTTKIERDPYMTHDMLVEHIKCIGQAIIDDAESIALNTKRIISIEISALISPGDRFTKINYDIDRYADPRIAEKKEDDNNEQE
ncbi:MAG: hypothetical protein IKE23_07880 [Exiguobacterium sp.]|nr:hypothetical protein [Exiguobacterium sp.]